MNVNDIKLALDDFLRQSEHVIAVTHKPSNAEYRHIALSTAIGMAAIGVIGYVINVVARILRGGG